jgi:hypothetical protein
MNPSLVAKAAYQIIIGLFSFDEKNDKPSSHITGCWSPHNEQRLSLRSINVASGDFDDVSAYFKLLKKRYLLWLRFILEKEACLACNSAELAAEARQCAKSVPIT